MQLGRNTFLILFKSIIVEILNLFIKRQNNLWLFSSTKNMKYNYNSKYLFEYILKNNPEIKAKFVINDKRKREALTAEHGNHFVETRSLKGMINALKASVWITSVGFPVHLIFSRYNRMIINLWHGVPLKKIALLEEDVSFIKKIYIKLFHSMNYSFVLTTSENLVDIYTRSFHVNRSKIKILGQPRNDLLNNSTERNAVLEKIYHELPDYKYLILYAPTFRDKSKTILFPFLDFDIDQINTWLSKNNAIIFIRFHQSETKDLKLNNSNRILYINDDVVEDIMEVLYIFDLLITDYSSLYIDHLILQKPQLFLPYDLNEYIKTRGLNFNYNEVTPGPKPSTQKEFLLEIEKLIKIPSYYSIERAHLNNYFNQILKDNCFNITNFIKNIK